MDVGDQFIGIRRDDRKGANPLTRSRFLQFSQMPPMPNGLSSFMAQLHPGAVGRPANSTGRYLQVLTANGGDHVLRCQPPPGDLLRIEPDAHGIIAGAQELDAADALDLRELVLDVEEILNFNSEANLQTWLNSTERNNLLEQAAAFTDEYHIRIVRMGFDQWFEVGVAGASSPPAWKQNMIVLLILAERGAKHVDINLLRYFSEPATLDSKAKTFLQRGMALAMEWATCRDWWSRMSARRSTAPLRRSMLGCSR